MKSAQTADIAAIAARLIVEDGMEYGPAKRRALRELSRHAGRQAPMPSNDEVEDEVRERLSLFHGETQPAELVALRKVALHWMERLAAFRPHLTGAVWRGTATRLNDVHLELYCDDSKAAELALLDSRIDYEVGTGLGPRGEPVDVLSLADRGDGGRRPGDVVIVHLTILDRDDLRGALKAASAGRSERGDLAALQRLLRGEAT